MKRSQGVQAFLRANDCLARASEWSVRYTTGYPRRSDRAVGISRYPGISRESFGLSAISQLLEHIARTKAVSNRFETQVNLVVIFWLNLA